MIETIGAMLFWVVWGAMENRVWKESGENWILGHFKTYHVAMGALAVATSLFGAKDIFQFLFLLIWAPLALDVTWWVIRYFDFKRDPVAAQKLYNQETNSWHEQGDWDNWLGFPLVGGCYWWWWLLGGMLVVLGVLTLK